ncbi:hypothetical protein [Pseudoalteromonas sp.]|uniref:hypothetical protein n=1 Tax=Pseudoalteromonas sp. TaxID=53249 RepID=UPI00356144B3
MKYFALVSAVYTALIHILSFTSVNIPIELVTISQVLLLGLVCLGLISVKRGTFGKQQFDNSLSGLLARFPFSFSFFALIAIYSVVSFHINSEKGGTTKVENGSYYVLVYEPKRYYKKISQREFEARVPYQIRFITGHLMAIYFGFFFILYWQNSAPKNQFAGNS